MKIIFLDIDGVCNCASTTQRHGYFIGIDPYMANLVKNLVEKTGAKIVLSSTWRVGLDSREEVIRCVGSFFDCTPILDANSPRSSHRRGEEIKAWLDSHPEITKWAILDDDYKAILPEQKDHYFRTTWEKGLTQEIANQVETYLKD